MAFNNIYISMCVYMHVCVFLKILVEIDRFVYVYIYICSSSWFSSGVPLKHFTGINHVFG